MRPGFISWAHQEWYRDFDGTVGCSYVLGVHKLAEEARKFQTDNR